MKTNKRKVLREAIETYGRERQIDMAIEEMSELTKALLKDRRMLGSQQYVAEEIADVLITVEQLIMIYDCEDKVGRATFHKIERLKERLANHPKNHPSTIEFDRLEPIPWCEHRTVNAMGEPIDIDSLGRIVEVEVPSARPWNPTVTENKNRGE